MHQEFDNYLLALYSLALRIATEKHDGQFDKSGQPYIGHPIRVAARCAGMKAKIVALLHDTIEDTDVTPDYLRENGFPEEIINALLSVSKHEGEPYDEYIRRASQDSLGRIVKIADLEDNMDIRRLKQITEKDVKRLVKYLRSWRFLNGLE